ncbi:MAG: hypothetical protein WDM89_11175 [Rhizomicrobium sp.]
MKRRYLELSTDDGSNRAAAEGASGNIAVTEWACTQFGDTIVETHLDDEHENFHGQMLARTLPAPPAHGCARKAHGS